MRILVRTLVTLAVAYALGVVLAATASAGTLHVTVMVSGAGTVNGATPGAPVPSCTQSPPVSMSVSRDDGGLLVN